MAIRNERNEDGDAIRAVHAAAFAPSEIEAALVDDLRAAGDLVPELCFVAVDDGALIGHVAISRATVDGVPALGLGPIGVLPERQRSGVGDGLMRAALAAAAGTDWPLIALLGHAEYYPRFGFEPAARLGVLPPFPVESQYWMAFRLPAYHAGVRGTFRYADAFPAHA